MECVAAQAGRWGEKPVGTCGCSLIAPQKNRKLRNPLNYDDKGLGVGNLQREENLERLP